MTNEEIKAMFEKEVPYSPEVLTVEAIEAMEEEKNMEKLHALTAAVEMLNPVSAWDRGVKAYALDLLEDLESALSYDSDILTNANLLVKALLNGASDWSQYSWGGSAMIYDRDIAARLCTPSELKKTHNGDRNPNRQEQWLDVQARALYQAERMILNQYKKL